MINAESMLSMKMEMLGKLTEKCQRDPGRLEYGLENHKTRSKERPPVVSNTGKCELNKYRKIHTEPTFNAQAQTPSAQTSKIKPTAPLENKSFLSGLSDLKQESATLPKQ